MIDKGYDEKGNAKHYDGERINAIRIFERTFGTEAVMYFCEINALKYRLRMGKKLGQSLEQELLKANWYERAAKHFWTKIQGKNQIIKGVGRDKDGKPVAAPLPWDEK